MYKIDKQVKLPPVRAGRPRKYPYDDMKPGDSFFKPSDNPKVAQANLHSSARNWSKRAEIKATFTTRRLVEGGITGVRVWRVK